MSAPLAHPSTLDRRRGVSRAASYVEGRWSLVLTAVSLPEIRAGTSVPQLCHCRKFGTAVRAVLSQAGPRGSLSGRRQGHHLRGGVAGAFRVRKRATLSDRP